MIFSTRMFAAKAMQLLNAPARIFFFGMIFTLSSFFAEGQATITPDKPDYAPRSNAIFTGTGFMPYETVVLKVKNLFKPCNTTGGDSSYIPWIVSADASGSFETNWTVCDCPGDSLKVKATGISSELVATALFSDAGNVSIINNSTITENFTGYAGTSPGPVNWTLLYTGGTTFNGTNQSTGTTGGWYGNANISFLGSGSASNGNATWLLQNNTGTIITGFTLSFSARMWRSNTGSPSVGVSWTNNTLSANPGSGSLSNSLSNLTFNDATTNISTGTTLTQTVSGLSLADGQFIFIRFIHSGGSNSDNLGWDNVSFTPTIGACSTPSTPILSVNDNCDGTSTLTVSGATGTLNFSGPGSVTGSGNSRTVTMAGSYTVTQTIGGCTSAPSNSVTATPKTAPSNPTGLTNQSRCGDGNVTFSVNDPGAGFTVEWSTDGTTNNDGTGAGGAGVLTQTKSVNAGTPIIEYARISNNISGCKSAWVSATGTANVFSMLAPVFAESMGNVGSTTTIAAHETGNGFDNDPFIMTGTGDVRNTSPSSGYTGASGNANVFITNTAVGINFQIANINTTGLSGLALSFGIFKGAGTNVGGSDLVVEVSSDGINYTALSYTALTDGSKWYYRTASGSIPATSNLRIRFTNTGTASQYRIDDVVLTKDVPAISSISASSPTIFCTPGSVTLNAVSANSYLWSNGATNQSINVTSSGSYYSTLTDHNGCSSQSNTIVVNALEGPTLFTVSGGGGYCPGGSATVNLSGSQTDVNYQLLLNGNPVGAPVPGTGGIMTYSNLTATGTYTIVGDNGSCTNAMTGSATVSINSVPVITCPANNITVSNTPGQCGAIVNFATAASATGTPNPSISYSPASGSFFTIGTTTVTATATNDCGTVICTFTVSVNDTQAPVAICQNITVSLDANGVATITPAMISNGSSDLCGEVTLSASRTSFNCNDLSVTQVPTDLIISEYVEGSSFNKAIEIYNGTSSLIDLSTGGYSIFVSRNGGTSTSTIGLTGTIVPGGVYVLAHSSANAIILGIANQTSGSLDFNGNDAVVLKKGAIDIDIFGVINENPGTAWTEAGNTTLDKTLRRKATIITGISTNPISFSTLATEWDQFNIDVVNGLGSHSASSTSTVPITLTVTDASGNQAICIAQVTVQDVTPPTINCPADIELPACTETASWTIPTASDNCSGTINVVQTAGPAPGSTFANGSTTTISYSATDEQGLVSTCSFTVSRAEALSAVLTSQTNVLCHGAATGSVVITPSGGREPYNITPSQTGLTAGLKTFTITDADNCSTTVSATITQPLSPLSITCTRSKDWLYFGLAGDQTATITGTPIGGTGPYTVSVTMNRTLRCGVNGGNELWVSSSGSTNSHTVCPNNSVNPVSNKTISAGESYSVNVTLMANATFTITVTDANGCTSSCTINMNAEDVRCLAGASGRAKVKICHKTANGCTEICVDENAVEAHLMHGDFLGKCTGNCEQPVTTFTTPVGEEEDFPAVKTEVVPVAAKVFDVQVSPNPSSSSFRLNISAPGNQPVQVRIFDELGRTLQTLANAGTKGSISLGENFRGGIYYAEVVQGMNRKIIKLVKLN